MSQPIVFVSYSHKDEAEKEELLAHLHVLQGIGMIDVWSDDRIGAGSDWKHEIKEAMARATVAILLVSANFLTSDFTLRNEVPTLLKRRANEGLIVLPVIAKACAWKMVDWLSQMNVRPRNGRPIWSNAGNHIDDDLAAIAEEVAMMVKEDQPEPVVDELPEELQQASPSDDQESALPRVSFAVPISDPNKKKAFEEVLQQMFPNHRRTIVEKEFGEGFSGSWVFLVTLMRDRFPDLPVVVKIAAPSLIEKEWRAYNDHILGRWPFIAEIKDQPVRSKDGTLKGLYYSLVGEGVFEVMSLRDYCLEAEIEDIQAVLAKRLVKIIELGLKYSDKSFKYRLRASYDPVLPVNLLINPIPLPDGVRSITVTPETLPIPELDPGGYVRLENFVVTKVDLRDKTVTLNLPRRETQLPDDSCMVRLKYTSEVEMPAYQIGNPLPTPVEGKVLQTRASQWQTELKKIITGQDFDMASQTVRLPDGTELPNPFAALPDILNRLRNIKVYHIHGDLNLENILVDPQARDVRLIDFAEARWDHVLPDFLRLETEVVTKLIPKAMIEAGLPVERIRPFYEQLHCVTFASPPLSTVHAPDPALEKAFAILQIIRKVVRDYGLFDRHDPTEYYDCLTLYLLGALKFGNLNHDISAPKPWPKQVAFWGAAVIQGLLRSDICKEVKDEPKVSKGQYNEERYLDAALPSHVAVDSMTELLVMVHLPDSDGLRGILKGEIEFQAQPEDVRSKKFEIEFPVDASGNLSASELWIEVQTTDFILPERRKKIKVTAAKDSEICIFLLTPKRRGELRIVIQVYLVANDLLLGTGFIKVNGNTGIDKSVQYLKNLITLSLGAFISKSEVETNNIITPEPQVITDRAVTIPHDAVQSDITANIHRGLEDILSSLNLLIIQMRAAQHLDKTTLEAQVASMKLERLIEVKNLLPERVSAINKLLEEIGSFVTQLVERVKASSDTDRLSDELTALKKKVDQVKALINQR